MPHHFTKNTVEATFWCKVCAKPTPHYVWDGRRGACKTCIEKQEAKTPTPPKPEQGSLF